MAEIQTLLGDSFKLVNLNDINFKEELLEEQDTLEGNASQKSTFAHNQLGYNCFADDTGLEIEALNNAPGVLSARYAGADKSADANMKKVLNELKGKQNRKARFRTVISLIIDGKEEQFEGVVEGKILNEQRGNQGFGYDPIFMPDGYDKTFAELTLEEKNSISHRGKAFKKLIEHLKNHINA